jgi:phosphoglycerate dehydrogenase-like enzyme
MRTINVLAIQRISADDRAKIEASDPAIRLIDAGGWFEGEIRETWSDFSASRYLPPGATGSGTREERDRLLHDAEVIIGGWPFPLDMRARAPRLKWFHQRQAGASNLLGSDLWGSDVVVTTSRGVANSLPIAEYASAGIWRRRDWNRNRQALRRARHAGRRHPPSAAARRAPAARL